MHARLVIFASAIFFSGSAVVAEPASPAANEPVQARPQPERAQIVLASADQVNAPDAAQQVQPTPQRARVARVTTCRCGDQQAQPEE